MNTKELLIAEMNRQQITDNELRAGLAAIIGGESNFNLSVHEIPYTNTKNSRIRSIFKTAFAGKSDAFINAKKVDPEEFFNYVYGPEGTGRQLGNILSTDGYKYRGRGAIQLTGRDNYLTLGRLTGLNLLGEPDLVNDPKNSVTIAVAYIKWRYKGGGWEAIKAAVGNSFGNVDARKNELFNQFMITGEFDAPVNVTSNINPATIDIFALQRILKDRGYYNGAIDGIARSKTADALIAYSIDNPPK